MILDTTIDNLNEEQISQLEALDPESPQMEEKISLFAAQIPGLAQVLEQKLNEEVAKIKQTGQIPQWLSKNLFIWYNWAYGRVA